MDYEKHLMHTINAGVNQYIKIDDLIRLRAVDKESKIYADFWLEHHFNSKYSEGKEVALPITQIILGLKYTKLSYSFIKKASISLLTRMSINGVIFNNDEALSYSTSIPTARFFIAKGGDVNNRLYTSPLFRAIRNDDIDLVMFLIQNKAVLTDDIMQYIYHDQVHNEEMEELIYNYAISSGYDLNRLSLRHEQESDDEERQRWYARESV